MSDKVRKLTTGMIRARYGVCFLTIKRWIEAGILPKPQVINRRFYFDEAEVQACERQRMAKAGAAA